MVAEAKTNLSKLSKRTELNFLAMLSGVAVKTTFVLLEFISSQ